MSHGIRDYLTIKTAAAGSFRSDGQALLIHANTTGTVQVYRTSPAGGDLVQITDFAEPVQGGYLRHSNRILLVRDEGGNERTQLWTINDDGTNLRPLVVDPEFLHQPGGVSFDGKTIAYASNRRNGVDFDIFVRDLETGDEACVFDAGGWCWGAGFSPDGSILAVSRATERNMDNEVFLVDLRSGDRVCVSPHDDEASIGAPRWNADGSSFFFSSDEGTDLAHIRRYDVRAGQSEVVLTRDCGLSCGIDRAGSSLIVAELRNGYVGIEFFDPQTLQSRGVLPVARSGVVVPRQSSDGRYVAYTLTSPVDPGDAWIFDTQTQETVRLTHSECPVDSSTFVEPEVHRFSSFDGESIPVFLFRPTGGGPTPVVVSIHGGPEGQYTPTFAAVTQYLVSRGYAVVAPNVRGSTGYGKRFHHLDDVYKRLDSVGDLAALHTWIGSVGGLDQARVALMGGSYGGYMVLAGLTFHPELWAAGVDIVGMSSLVTFLENTAPYRRAVREREYGSLERDRDFLAQVSPLTFVDRLRAPLFIIHGANDPRVPLGEAEQLHRALSEKGIDCELLVYPDEGHGLGKLANRIDAYPRVTEFLDRIIGGGQ